MKKLVILALASVTLSSCSWTKHEFFGEEEAQNNNSQYPYYYSSAAAPATQGSIPGAPNTAGAIDANEQQNSLVAAPLGNQAQAQPFYATQSAQPSFAQPNYGTNATAGGYSVQSSAPSVSINYGNKGTDMSAAKNGAGIPNPNPVLPNSTTVTADQNRAAAVAAQNSLPQLPTSPQYQGTVPQFQTQQAPYAAVTPSQYPAPASYGAPQTQTPAVISPYQPQPSGYAPQVQPYNPQPAAFPIQPQPIATGQTNGGLTYEQYQQMYYGQAPYNVPPFQYPPVK